MPVKGHLFDNKEKWKRGVQSNGVYLKGCHQPDDDELIQRGEIKAGEILVGPIS